MFYWVNEYFDIIGDTINVTEDKLTITGTKDTTWNHATFGARKIKSTDIGIYKWSLKFTGSITGISFGISDKERRDTVFAWDDTANYYGLLRKNKFRKGDQGDMIMTDYLHKLNILNILIKLILFWI